MRISRLVLLLALTSFGFVTPAAAGQRGGHPPRPTVLPPLLHGGTPPRAAPVRPQHHVTRHHRPGGWAGGGHRRGEAAGYPMYGWPSTVWQQPARASRAGRAVTTPRFEAIVLAPGMATQAERGAATPRRPHRIVRGYYDTPRPMAKIIHIGRTAKH